ncbi:proton-conducting transporter membrane subunit [Actinomadura yumaensis]|uniref:proton-conducting transporter transmembrane domain-containing protein n=1 Tax=Actinomadura yumaensis TaxID=111807 RepID=UPI00360E2290
MAQRHVKRLLAYSTISHVGLLLVGVALLDGESLGGAAFFLLGHAGVKAALFLGAGALLNHFQSVDEDELHGRGGTLRVTTWTFLAGGSCCRGCRRPGCGRASRPWRRRPGTRAGGG